MTIITLESIKADSDALAAKIATFESQSNLATTAFYFPEVTIELSPGEHYAGLIVGQYGEPSHHLILLPGQVIDVTWEKAIEWAAKQGGDFIGSLPTRREQSLLFANLKDQFEDRYYWSCEAHESESGWAWCQHFLLGSQLRSHRRYELRARAVRRLVIE